MNPYDVLLIGEAPARNRAKRNLQVVLACRTVQHLPKAGTMTWLKENHPKLCEFSMRTRHANLLDYWPGREVRGSKFPVEEARRRAEQMRTRINARIKVVLFCGKRVAAAFGYYRAEYFVELGGLDVPAYVVPHPSGVVRWWNVEANRTRAKEFLEQW